ncbi:MAG TPA: hypothetical protein VN704_03115 [Verrucomicrobiae bacterium]|nr:hypothetical protein [Verrucomicrobiae bacterium]
MTSKYHLYDKNFNKPRKLYFSLILHGILYSNKKLANVIAARVEKNGNNL